MFGNTFLQRMWSSYTYMNDNVIIVNTNLKYLKKKKCSNFTKQVVVIEMDEEYKTSTISIKARFVHP